MQLALADAGLPPSAIGYVNGHGTATEHGDIAETLATSALLGNRKPISSQKSYLGHTLGACGALESWFTIEMMKDGLARADAQPGRRRSPVRRAGLHYPRRLRPRHRVRDEQ